MAGKTTASGPEGLGTKIIANFDIRHHDEVRSA
jgi:hypothetical protein